MEKTLKKSGTILAVVPVPTQKPLRALGGAVFASERIGRAALCPDDFDAFWQAKIDELKAVPENPVLEPGGADQPGVGY